MRVIGGWTGQSFDGFLELVNFLPIKVKHVALPSEFDYKCSLSVCVRQRKTTIVVTIKTWCVLAGIWQHDITITGNRVSTDTTETIIYMYCIYYGGNFRSDVQLVSLGSGQSGNQ